MLPASKAMSRDGLLFSVSAIMSKNTLQRHLRCWLGEYSQLYDGPILI